MQKYFFINVGNKAFIRFKFLFLYYNHNNYRFYFKFRPFNRLHFYINVLP